MIKNDTSPMRGRPKTLNREHVLQIAMSGYWAEGPTNIAIGEICRRAKVSKPGLYREFGSDDGLKTAVLEHYRQIVLKPMYEILESEGSFGNVVEAFIEFVAQDRERLGIPSGCLQIAMRTHRNALGELAGAKVDELRHATLKKYKALVERAKTSGEFKSEMPSEVAALYFDAQNGSAMRMQNEGVPNDTIKEILRQAFAAIC